jgi:hypothetical protein
MNINFRFSHFDPDYLPHGRINCNRIMVGFSEFTIEEHGTPSVLKIAPSTNHVVAAIYDVPLNLNLDYCKFLQAVSLEFDLESTRIQSLTRGFRYFSQSLQANTGMTLK